MKKQPQRYDADWRKQAHSEAQAFLAKIKARDEAAAKVRAEIKAARQRGANHARDQHSDSRR